MGQKKGASKKKVKCSICQDSKHIRGEQGRMRRCECLMRERRIEELAAIGYDSLEDPIYASAFSGDPEWDKQSFILRGDPKQGMRIVGGLFHSASRKANKRCFITSGFQLVDTFFGRDPRHATMQDYVKYDYLAFLLGVGEAPNKFVPKLVRQVQELRQIRSKITVFMVAGKVTNLKEVYDDSALIDMLQKIGRECTLEVSQLIEQEK